MKNSAIVSLVCWLSVAGFLWMLGLGVVEWGPDAWASLSGWVLMGLISGTIDTRYKTAGDNDGRIANPPS